MANPILPRNKANPIQTGRIVARSFKDLRVALAKVQRGLLERFREIPFRVVDAETGVVLIIAPQGEQGMKLKINQGERIYEYQLDPGAIARTAEFINELLVQFVLENRQPDWFMRQQVETSYELGTAETVRNLQTIAPADYTRTLQGVLTSQPYQRRIQFTFARVFEEMQGFTNDTRRDLARTLADGISAGDNPRTVARRIRDRIGVANSRAQRIARTEINMAHRRARWDEDQSAQQDLGIMTMQLHLSALSSTTRRTHARRHGTLHTVQDQRSWYTRDANGINCKCSSVSVLVDENGEPRTPDVVDKTKKQGQEFFEKEEEKKPVRRAPKKPAPAPAPGKLTKEEETFVKDTRPVETYRKPVVKNVPIDIPTESPALLKSPPPKPPKLNSQEVGEIENYKGEGFYDINRKLREPDKFSKREIDDATRRNEALSTIISKNKTTKDHTFYRGIRSKELFESAESLIGKSLKNVTPQSTTFDPSVAKSYAGVIGGFTAERDASVLMKIRTKKGTSAINLSEVTDINSSEREILLKGNSTYKVIGVRDVKAPNGSTAYREIEVEYDEG